MARLGLTLLGGFQARRDDGDMPALPIQKSQALLAYLAMPLSQAHPRDKLTALLWGDMSERQARAGLRHALFRIRKALDDPEALRAQGETISLDPALVMVDVEDFERCVADGTQDGLARAAARPAARRRAARVRARTTVSASRGPGSITSTSPSTPRSFPGRGGGTSRIPPCATTSASSRARAIRLGATTATAIMSEPAASRRRSWRGEPLHEGLTPAKPASQAPRQETMVKSWETRMPSTRAGSSTPARIMAPSRVRSSKAHSPAAKAMAMRLMASR